MKARLVPIGTSKGVRLPKFLLDKYHFSGEVEMIETKEGIILKATKTPREGWKEAFAKVADSSHDKEIEMPSSQWDEKDWQWK